MENESLSVDVSITRRSSAAGDVEVRELALGSSTAILVEVQTTVNPDTMTVNIDATDFDTMENLAEFFEFLAGVVRSGDQ